MSDTASQQVGKQMGLVLQGPGGSPAALELALAHAKHLSIHWLFMELPEDPLKKKVNNLKRMLQVSIASLKEFEAQL